MEHRAGLLDQRQLGKSLDKLLDRHLVTPQIGLFIKFFHRIGCRKIVGEPRSVRQQMFDRDRIGRIDQRWLLDRSARANFQILQLRNVAIDWISQIELPFFKKLHHRRARDHLRHRINPKDCVRCHRHFLCQVAIAVQREVCDLALARDHAHGSGMLSLLDVSLNGVMHPVQPLWRKPNPPRARRRQWRSGEDAIDTDCDQKEEEIETFHNPKVCRSLWGMAWLPRPFP